MAPQSPRGTVLSTSVGLTCGGVGLVREIIYEKNQAPPSLPVTLLVDFKVGGFYRGISWLGADGVDTDYMRVVEFAPKRDDFKRPIMEFAPISKNHATEPNFHFGLRGHEQSTKARVYRWSTSLEILETPSSPLD